jgi:hypothetical protein
MWLNEEVVDLKGIGTVVKVTGTGVGCLILKFED